MGWMCVQTPPLTIERPNGAKDAPVDLAIEDEAWKDGDISRLLLFEKEEEEIA